MIVSINMQSIQDKITKAGAVSKKAQKEASLKIDKVFPSTVDDLINTFEEDKASQEILDGAFGETSSILPEDYGNLYSFIGFKAGREPIEEMSKFLRGTIKFVQKTPSKIQIIKGFGGGYIKFSFRVNFPSWDQIKERAKMDWPSDKSWVDAVRNGLSGFLYYLQRARGFAKSRSGGAIQAKAKGTKSLVRVRQSGSFTGTKRYLQDYLREFKSNLLEKI